MDGQAQGTSFPLAHGDLKKKKSNMREAPEKTSTLTFNRNSCRKKNKERVGEGGERLARGEDALLRGRL